MKLIIPEPPRPPRKKIAIAPIEQTKPLSVTEVAAIAARLVENIEKVIVGKHEQVCTAVITLLAEGHLLIQDIPGVAKTMLARALAQSVGGTFNRIQCTPDLQPADILGEPFLVRETGQSEYKFGPLFANIVLVDEINRASPRTQAAMLEAMGEGLISIERVTYRMERPFMVVATQNPIEHEGTFGLPEAQLDRFLIRMTIGYPSIADERQMCRNFQLGHPIETLNPVTSPDAIMKCQEAVRTVEVEPEVCEKILERVQQTRRHAALVLGASPRGSLGLFRAAQAAAAMEGKASVSAEKVDELAEAVLAHRLLLRPELKERWNQGNDVIREILSGKSVG